MRPTRLLYVENDPALRGILAALLDAHPDLELLLSADAPDVLLASPMVEQADAALLDLALGSSVMTGIDLGLALRQRNPHIGIIIHSQHDLTHLARRVPERERMGWSYVPKTGDMPVADLVSIIRETARGMSVGPGIGADGHMRPMTPVALDQLTTRQRAVLGQLATGQGTQEIARRLGVTQDTVRQDLSKAYRILVPDAVEGEDVRIKAVLAYRHLVRDTEWDSP